MTNTITSNINKYWRLFSFKKIKFWFIKVIKVNTPNKTDKIDINHSVVSLKNYIEQIKEQVQNILWKKVK